MSKIGLLVAKTNVCQAVWVTFFTVTFAIADSGFIFATRNLRRSHRLGVRTPDFHSGNTGSIPVGTTSTNTNKTKTSQITLILGFFAFTPLHIFQEKSIYW